MQAQFLKKAGELLSEGYTLNEALSFMKIHWPKKYHRDLELCIQWLSEGNSLSTAFNKIGFHRRVLSYLFFAEKHGDLKFAFKESALMMEKQMAHLEKFVQVIRYPIFLSGLLMVILLVVQTIVAPQFTHLFDSMQTDASFFLFLLTIVFQGIKWVLIIMVILTILMLVGYWSYVRKMPPIKQQLLFLKIPLVSKALRLFHSYYFSLQLSNLLRGGLSVFECLTLFQEQSLLPFYKEEATIMIEQLKTGQTLDRIISNQPFFEKELAAVIFHGQTVGHLARELYTYSRFLLEKMEEKFIKMTSFIQPTIFICIGIFILVVYLSILLPMYEMMEKI